MASKQPSDLVIADLRGGMDDEHPPHTLPDDVCELAENVEFFYTTLGERRLGCVPINIAGSGLDAEEDIVHLGTHLPATAEVYQAELWAVGATPLTSTAIAHRLGDQATWEPIDVPVGMTLDYSIPAVFRMRSQTLHGLFFLAANSNLDRMLVFDANFSTTALRLAGLAAPADAPTVMDSASGGSFTGDRIYRVRVIEKDGSVIIRQSEPSPEVTFTPSGVNDGAIVTRPNLPGEGETDWELEASDGDGNFYIIATLPVATMTYTDTTQPATDYANVGTLSADIGDYVPLPSAKYIVVDQDRLVLGGSWENADQTSRVWWTPVSGDPGFGNLERVSARLDSFVDLDWQDGGELTGLSDPINGVFYAFKWNRIYKFQRTGNFASAYDSFLLTPHRGAIYGSIVNGMDEFGKGCVYFLDPSVGPMRVGSQGLQHIQNLRGTWRHVNTKAGSIISHGVYYPDKKQVKWWVAVDGSDTPMETLVLQINQVRSDGDGTQRGWAIATGRSTEAYCSVIHPETITDTVTGAPRLTFLPYIGLPNPDFIQRTDIGSLDAGQEYVARIRTKPYILAGLLNKWGAMAAALLAQPNDDPDVQIAVRFIRDFGKEVVQTFTDFTPDATEEQVIKIFDALALSDARVIQIEFVDV